MRFGHFFYPMKFDDSRDEQEILACLDEAQLVEELGMDAIWFAEHYFTGECVYGDPLVFASAVAVKTKKIMLGFGILELPLHNPVRVAIQTALLDNLCQGRLVVGTGRGSNYNAFEYVGFGTTPGLGKQQLDEAEELLVKAWTEDNVDFRGKYWQVSFPSVRPRPYQKPHPPLARACTGDASLVEMAKIGRPVLIRGNSTNGTGEKIRLFRDTMSAAGFGEAAVEQALDQIWVWREMHVAESDGQAMDEFLPVHHDAYAKMEAVRQRWNPPEMDISIQRAPIGRSAYGEAPNPDASESMVGSPKRVAEQVAMMRDVGVRNLMLTNRGLVSQDKAAKSLHLLSEKVMPSFQGQGA
ncbi:MAG: LLM class flavin-dependent oxidoreductase [Chloroflexi bacterium]|nr:LLM class flavin-dependent oxidoreductase [Chloroflexota bacterium]MDA1271849.1 LLM class flavin-dependent oxidoreductase [Chloroflexota bacterium]